MKTRALSQSEGKSDEYTQKESPISSPGPTPRRLLEDLRHTWPRIYAALWLSTLGSAVLVALAGSWLRTPVRELLRARLDPSLNAPAHLGHVLLLVAHNLPISIWPVLLGVVGAHRKQLTRRLADMGLVAALMVSTMSTGAALGAYGMHLLAYIPQLPVEWAGVAVGASAWLVQRRRPLDVHEGIKLVALTASALAVAALIETIAVPHR